ncbi:hypothetical protein QQ045_007141 [Rhodiola kirilowii]
MASLPNLKVDHLARVASDHCPLLISFVKSSRKSAGFKYLRAWDSHTEFLDVVQEAWSGNLHANPLLNFALKLQALRRRLKAWNWTSFGNTSSNLRSLSRKIAFLEQQFQVHGSESLRDSIQETKQEFAITQRSHYQILADKAKANRITEGDRNSSVFHALIKSRRAPNSVKIELPHGSFTEDRLTIGI